MKYVTALCAAALVLGLTGCGPGVELPPVEPDQVEVIMPGMPVGESYKVLAAFTVDVPIADSDSELLAKAKARAAQMGADALLVKSIRRTSEGQVEQNLRQEQMKIAECQAIYFPSRHPELESK
jgi:hypothetical protein